MEMIRRAVLPGQATDTVLSACSTLSLVCIFSVMALLLFIFSVYFFKALENEMRRAGTIDMTTAY
jgi:hypothetical protein